MSRPLRFGTYVEFQCPPGKDHAQLIEDVIALGIHADQNGFSVFTTLEHPFFEQFAINPNPLPCIAPWPSGPPRFASARCAIRYRYITL